jgi:uncharacterized protein (PEP-CTERM system associated)
MMRNPKRGSRADSPRGPRAGRASPDGAALIRFGRPASRMVAKPQAVEPTLGPRSFAAFALALSLAPMTGKAATPPLPGDTGVGSLPSARAAALPRGEDGQPLPSNDTAPQIRLGNFGFPITGEQPVLAEPGRTFTITPSIEVQALATDNVFQRANRKSSDVITTVTPGVVISADTARLQGVLNYRPSARFYANNSDENSIDQNFDGAALVTLIPGFAFLDVRGQSSVRSASGGRAPESGLVTEEDDRLQTTSFQISPYIVQRFGDTATLQVGYGYLNVDQSGNSLVQGPNGQFFSVGQSYEAHQGYAVVRTGPAFGRLALEGRLEATEYVGEGVLDGAYRRIGTVEARYAILRGLYVLGEIGYEQQKYGGNPGIEIDEPVWSVGVRVDVTDRGTVTVRYGRRNGFNSASLDAAVQVGVRTRMSARYSEGLSNSALEAGDLLTTTTLDQFGNPVDLATGLPAARPFAGSFLGSENSLNRVKTASATLSQAWPRDRFAATVTREERTPVSVAVGGSNFSQTGTSGSLTWARALSERTDALAYVQYGRTSSNVFGDGTVFSVGLTFVQQLREGLVGQLQFGRNTRDNSGVNGSSTQNFVLIGLRQTF